jgi:SecY interacting protein Syd
MTTSIYEAQARFYHRYLSAARAITGALPVAEVDLEAASPCVVGDPDERGMVAWQPVLRGVEGDVTPLERALGAALHPATRAWLARWYSLPIEATWNDETVVLLGAANDLELARFVEAARILGLYWLVVNRPPPAVAG